MRRSANSGVPPNFCARVRLDNLGILRLREPGAQRGCGMARLAFISYRRDDTSAVAQGLYLQLKARFGSGQLFMDVNSVPAGTRWPPRIQDKLREATVVLAVIGPAWLTASDQWGRRRLDKVNDWVRLELEAALDQHKGIIPVLVGHEISPSPDEALPKKLRGLFKHEYIRLRPEVETWNEDMNSVGRQLIEWGLKDNEAGPTCCPHRCRGKGIFLASRRMNSTRRWTISQAGNRGRTPSNESTHTPVRNCRKTSSSTHSRRQSNSWRTLHHTLPASTTTLDGATNGRPFKSG